MNFQNEKHAVVAKIASADATLAEKHVAFDAIVMTFQDMAYACAYAVLGDFHLAEDASQQAFITAWQKIHQLREPAAFPGWFKRIVLTECHRMTRRKRVRTTPLDDSEHRAAIGENPQKKLETDELRRTVFSAIELLPVNERIAVTLFYLDEQTHADISSFLDVPTTTVAKRLHTARARLKGKLMSEFKRQVVSRRPSRNARFAKKVRAGVYDEYVGRYQFELRPDLIVTITRDGDSLISEAKDQRNELFGRDNELQTSEFDGRGTFVRDDGGGISHLVYYEFGQEMGLARKIS
jgi:RNA polymerase sigma factor (sigma-70 family)